jgi:hypothetical protein
MDPTESYLAMFEAMRQQEFQTAREHAIALRDWLESGGFYPPNYHPDEVKGYLNNVLRRTSHIKL